MQASSSSHNVRLSTHVKGKPRKEPLWELRYRNGKKDSTKTLGKAWQKQSRPPAGYLTKTQAEIKAQEFMDAQAEFVPEDRKTFGRASAEYLEHAETEKGLRGSTLHEYRRITKRLCERHWRGTGENKLTWRDRPLDSFTETDLTDLRQEMKGAGRNSHTLNQTRGVLRGIFGERRVIQCWKWMALKRQESKGKISFYSPAEVAKLKEHAADDRDRAVYTVATELGLRISEIRGLKIAQVDFEAGIIRIEDGYTTTGGHAGTKGHKVRSLPLTANARAAVWPFCSGRSPHAERGLALVFEEAPGLPLGYYQLRRRFEAAKKAAGLHHITIHQLRHTFGTQMIRHVDIYTLQRLMGHEKISTTEIYLHYKPDPNLGEVMSNIWSNESGNVVPLRQAS